MNWRNSFATTIQWTKEISNREKKEEVAKKMAQRAKDGDVIGVGSGSTSFLAIQAIGERAKNEKINITAIPTSAEVALTCTYLNIPTTTLVQLKPDWAFDGADEVDPANSLIKGRGGAMFYEKLMLKSSPENYIIIDDSKLVPKLGASFPIPIEVHPLAVHLVETLLYTIGATKTSLRLAEKKDGPVITESGNFIIDTVFKDIDNHLEREIKCIPGVIESGLFIGYNIEIVKS